MPKPLEGLRVLDLTQFYSGPWATLLLAGLGAEVIKVNHPATGDVVAMGPPYAGPKGVSFHRQSEDDLGIAYLKRTRNKKSLTLNLKEPRGLDLFYRLVDEADVLVENFSVGVTERLKIDYETLEKRKPRLIYCSITSYGQSGPDARLKGYDAVTQAVSGLMNLTGFPDGPPHQGGLRHRGQHRGHVRLRRHHHGAPASRAHRPRPVDRRLHGGLPLIPGIR